MLSLSEEQKDLLATFEKPVLLEGGSGSGKSYALAHKVGYAIASGMASDRILVLFPNRHVIAQFKTYLKEGGVQDLPLMMSIEDYALQLLRDHHERLGIEQNFILYDHLEQLRIIMDILLDEDAGSDVNPHRALQTIGKLKSRLIGVDAYASDKTSLIYDPVLESIYRRYEDMLTTFHALDRHDILFKVSSLIAADPAFLSPYQSQISLVLIDGYEQLFYAQHRFCFNLSLGIDHVVVSGDFDVLSLRGQGDGGRDVLAFEKDYGDAHIIRLSHCFRSTKSILTACEAVIGRSNNSKGSLWTRNMRGDHLTYYVAFDEQDEANYIAGQIKRLIQRNPFKFSDVTVACRTQTQLQKFEDTFIEQDISYRIVSPVKFYAQSELQDIIAYLRLVYNPNDIQALSRLLHLNMYGLEHTDIHQLVLAYKAQDKSLSELMKSTALPGSKELQEAAYRIHAFCKAAAELHHNNGGSLASLIRYILDESGYQHTLEQENSVESLEQLSSIENMLKRLDLAAPDLSSFLTDLCLETEGDYTLDRGDAVTLVSFPCSRVKGRSNQVLFIAGFEEGLVPHYESQFDHDAEEAERQLFYGCLSQARQHVYLVGAHQRSLFGDTWNNDISRFLKLIPQKVLTCVVSERVVAIRGQILQSLEHEHIHFETTLSQQRDPAGTPGLFDIGDAVEHRTWGKGIISKIDGAGDKTILCITFSGEERRLMAKYAAVTKL